MSVKTKPVPYVRTSLTQVPIQSACAKNGILNGKLGVNEIKTAIVVGAGSIGLRHANVLKAIGFNVVFVTSRTELTEQVFPSIPEALSATQASYVVIANITSKHAEAVQALAKVNYVGKVLVEKPAQLGVLAENEFEALAVAFNLRLHPGLLKLREQIRTSEVYAVECYVGQHLDTWRPGRDKSEQYSAYLSQGGGVLRDLSHELDYLTWIFGDVLEIAATGGRVADVTVDADDSWAIIGRLEKAPQFSLQMNYLDTKPRRELRVLTSKGTVRVDLINMQFETEDGLVELSGKTADTYEAMHRAFLSGKAEELASLEAGDAVDRLIQIIESAAREKRWVTVK